MYVKKKMAKILTVEANAVKTKILMPYSKKKGSKVTFCVNNLNAYNSG